MKKIKILPAKGKPDIKTAVNLFLPLLIQKGINDLQNGKTTNGKIVVNKLRQRVQKSTKNKE